VIRARQYLAFNLRLVKHAPYYWLLLAESHLTGQLFGGVPRRMPVLPLPTGYGRLAELKIEERRRAVGGTALERGDS